jgi:hypothetical protein
MSVAVKIDNKRKCVVIELPLEEPRPSASGKSLLLATSHGCQSGDALYRGRSVVVAASAFIFPNRPPKVSKNKQKKRNSGGNNAS